jgi:hypothetical protein
MKSMSYDGSQTAMPFFAFENDAGDHKEFTPTRKAKGDAFVIGGKRSEGAWQSLADPFVKKSVWRDGVGQD